MFTMFAASGVGGAGSGASRRTLYRQSKRLLLRLLSRTGKGPRGALEPAVRRFLRARPRGYLVRLAGDRAFALAAAAALLAAGTAGALPPIDLSDIAAGDGGFVMNGIDPVDRSGYSVSGAGDVNGDELADVIVGASGADLGPNFQETGESYVVVSPVIPGDLDGDGTVGVVDLLLLLAAWGPCLERCPPFCPGDLDGDCTVGIVDLLILLANWG